MDSIVRSLLKKNTREMRINNVNGKYYFIDKKSPITVENYKVLYKKIPKIKKLKKIGKKVGTQGVKSNIIKELAKRKIADPMQITIKVKRKPLNNSKPPTRNVHEKKIIHKLMTELRRLQKKI